MTLVFVFVSSFFILVFIIRHQEALIINRTVNECSFKTHPVHEYFSEYYSVILSIC